MIDDGERRMKNAADLIVSTLRELEPYQRRIIQHIIEDVFCVYCMNEHPEYSQCSCWMDE